MHLAVGFDAADKTLSCSLGTTHRPIVVCQSQDKSTQMLNLDRVSSSGFCRPWSSVPAREVFGPTADLFYSPGSTPGWRWSSWSIWSTCRTSFVQQRSAGAFPLCHSSHIQQNGRVRRPARVLIKIAGRAHSLVMARPAEGYGAGAGSPLSAVLESVSRDDDRVSSVDGWSVDVSSL